MGVIQIIAVGTVVGVGLLFVFARPRIPDEIRGRAELAPRMPTTGTTQNPVCRATLLSMCSDSLQVSCKCPSRSCARAMDSTLTCGQSRENGIQEWPSFSGSLNQTLDAERFHCSGPSTRLMTTSAPTVRLRQPPKWRVSAPGPRRTLRISACLRLGRDGNAALPVHSFRSRSWGRVRSRDDLWNAGCKVPCR